MANMSCTEKGWMSAVKHGIAKKINETSIAGAARIFPPMLPDPRKPAVKKQVGLAPLREPLFELRQTGQEFVVRDLNSL
jgi:hypothetical protein